GAARGPALAGGFERAARVSALALAAATAGGAQPGEPGYALAHQQDLRHGLRGTGAAGELARRSTLSRGGTRARRRWALARAAALGCGDAWRQEWGARPARELPRPCAARQPGLGRADPGADAERRPRRLRAS